MGTSNWSSEVEIPEDQAVLGALDLGPVPHAALQHVHDLGLELDPQLLVRMLCRDLRQPFGPLLFEVGDRLRIGIPSVIAKRRSDP